MVEVKIKTHTATLKILPYHCPACGANLKELIPNELYLCEPCDLMYENDEINTGDTPASPRMPKPGTLNIVFPPHKKQDRRQE